MSSSNKGKIDDHRRKWDVDKFEKLAKERADGYDKDDKHDKSSIPVKRELLKERDYEVDLDSKVGKSIVITKTTPSSLSGGYYCNVCDCVIKDSMNFLDHINGKKHQRNLGMSMRIERSSLEDVKNRFASNKRKKLEVKKTYDFEARIQELKEEEEKMKATKKERRKEKKMRPSNNSDDEGGDIDPEMAAMMGFSGFGSTKK
ncbi:Zinc finger matrin-type protein 2 [Trichoplax sp. H2]|uniref:Matrin-type domain-containing protein n=1 Tax=Trichoplax adhaerens TaxID=10228 RepID=B3S6Z2_TRIAD|nr:hypothetical protein TRIADDRAFT_59979 [Trichoplax adhaerens]EDV21478.1 hypothetical protein TRIADDRAFT_59979 [Trichoplax adhaerens]RDD41398.1 Zinc finger matrin-type protein 2 [Trichoplax sp. H2]|eukprot:XP_002116078.1 hypothetical protein TRIADDRAFT_59979 [Trichoplax adhaerens]